MDFGSWFNTRNPTQADDAFVGAKIVPFEEQLDCYLRINPLRRLCTTAQISDNVTTDPRSVV